jgi:hypothetical protein
MYNEGKQDAMNVLDWFHKRLGGTARDYLSFVAFLHLKCARACDYQPMIYPSLKRLSKNMFRCLVWNKHHTSSTVGGDEAFGGATNSFLDGSIARHPAITTINLNSFFSLSFYSSLLYGSKKGRERKKRRILNA